ncbi:MAG: GDSL-type esterase/lipase family protein [Schleiferilactobacillus harbinensis]|jgi:hypothetical protein|nr:GDSL-type esterase/lipase family protein [Schleiferilactobacillus harbinensis]
MSWQKAAANGIFPGVHFTGRWQARHIGPHFVMYTTNLGAALSFQLDGASRAILHFLPTSQLIPPQVAIRIDDGRFVHFDLAHLPIMLAVSPQPHQVTVVMSGNTDDDPVWNADAAAGFAFSGVTLPDGGTLTPIAPAGPKLTFIGDSITAGCWVMGHSPSKDYRAEAAYPAVAAEKLGAEETRIAYSAAGILQPGKGGVPAAKDFFGHIDDRTPWAVNTGQDAVIVNLGTNDQAYPVEEFVSAYVRFAAQLRGVYDYDTAILLMVPFNQALREPIRHIAHRGDRLQVVETAGWNITTSDGSHPDLEGHKTAAKHLVGILQQVLASQKS